MAYSGRVFVTKIRMLRARKFKRKQDGVLHDPKKEGFAFEKTDRKNGVNKETLRQWVKDKADADKDSIVRICEFVNKELIIPNKEILMPEDFSDDISIGEFGRIIGCSEQEMCEHAFSEYFHRFGPHAEYIYRQRDIRGFMSEFEGGYHLFRVMKNINGDKVIVRCGIYVGAAVHPADVGSDKQSVIVARMSIPSLRGGLPYMYTGALCLKQQLTTWNFVQQERNRRDFVFIMTSIGEVDHNNMVKTGHMITMDQVESAPTPITYNICIRRLAKKGLSEQVGLKIDAIEEFLLDAASLEPEIPAHDIVKVILLSKN